MRISDWSSDVCSSDLHNVEGGEQKDSDYRTKVTMTFKGLDDGRTLVEIAAEGWRENQGALGASYGNCQGWSQMLCALKAWLEPGINLRDGMYVCGRDLGGPRRQAAVAREPRPGAVAGGGRDDAGRPVRHP